MCRCGERQRERETIRYRDRERFVHKYKQVEKPIVIINVYIVKDVKMCRVTCHY